MFVVKSGFFFGPKEREFFLIELERIEPLSLILSQFLPSLTKWANPNGSWHRRIASIWTRCLIIWAFCNYLELMEEVDNHL